MVTDKTFPKWKLQVLFFTHELQICSAITLIIAIGCNYTILSLHFIRSCWTHIRPFHTTVTSFVLFTALFYVFTDIHSFPSHTTSSSFMNTTKTLLAIFASTVQANSDYLQLWVVVELDLFGSKADVWTTFLLFSLQSHMCQ